MISKEEGLAYLNQGFDKLDIERPTNEILDKLWQYFTELTKWSAKINLVAKGPDLELLENHFIDCFTLVPTLNKLIAENCSHRLLDIGSGAGFPGLVLKIACPSLPVTLVEPRQKRTSFLRHIVRTLRLEKIAIIEDRIAKADQKFSTNHGQFSLITCRALTSMQEFLEMICHIAAPDAKILFMKGPKANEELSNWQNQPVQDCFSLTSSTTLSLPFSQAARSLVVFTKNKPVTIQP